MRASIVTLLLASTMGLAGVGCSQTRDAQSDQQISPDGRTQTQTRTRVRETPTGAVYRETQTQQRDVLRTREEAATTRQAND